jgi:hypothetical protein
VMAARAAGAAGYEANLYSTGLVLVRFGRFLQDA